MGVSSGGEALAALRAAAELGLQYDLAILDCQMPGMDGVMLARAIKAEPALAGVPLMMMTSLGLHDEGELRAAGLVMRLTKPVKQAQLHDSLARLLAAPGAVGALPGHAAEVGPRERRRARILVAEDNIINQKVVLLQLRRLGYSADSVANGRDAVEATALIAYDIVLMDCQMSQLDGVRGGAVDSTGRNRRAAAGADHCDGRACAGWRPGQVSGRRHGRLPQQAGEAGRSGRHPGAVGCLALRTAAARAILAWQDYGNRKGRCREPRPPQRAHKHSGDSDPKPSSGIRGCTSTAR